jgi:hypothetical protein
VKRKMTKQTPIRHRLCYRCRQKGHLVKECTRSQNSDTMCASELIGSCVLLSGDGKSSEPFDVTQLPFMDPPESSYLVKTGYYCTYVNAAGEKDEFNFLWVRNPSSRFPMTANCKEEYSLLILEKNPRPGRKRRKARRYLLMEGAHRKFGFKAPDENAGLNPSNVMKAMLYA